jgi:hypothetical protein
LGFPQPAVARQKSAAVKKNATRSRRCPELSAIRNRFDVRKFAAQKLSEEEALQSAIEQKSREFTAAGSEICSKS